MYMDKKIANEKMRLRGDVELILTNVTNGIKVVDRMHNVVCTVGKNSLASALIGVTNNNRGIITYCALGTNSTAPVADNMKLGDEIFRKLVSARSASGNVAMFETFFTTSEANGNLKEAGLFGDDAGEDKDSGTLFSHVAINRTKTANDTLILRWTVTFN